MENSSVEIAIGPWSRTRTLHSVQSELTVLLSISIGRWKSARWIGWDHFKPKRSSKLILIVPELSQLSAQTKSFAGVFFFWESSHHPAFTTAALSREEKRVEKPLTTMESLNFINPFDQESDSLFSLITKDVMPENVRKDLREQSNMGKNYSNDL